jgi:hypothetical protein
VRVAGVIQSLDTTAQTFLLGGLTVHYSVATTIIPANLALANGQTVAMWSLAAVNGNVAEARFIRVLRRNFPHQSVVRIEGPVSGCGATVPCSEPVIDGVSVVINAATNFTFGTRSDVVDGRTMHVRSTLPTASWWPLLSPCAASTPTPA